MDCHTGTTAAASSTLDMRYDGATTVSNLTSAFTLRLGFFLPLVDSTGQLRSKHHYQCHPLN